MPRFALGPVSEASSFSPWFAVPSSGRFGLYVAGELAESDRLVLEWGDARPELPNSLGTDPIVIPSAPERESRLPWRFIAAGTLEPPPPGATAVRVGLVNDSPPGAAIAVTAPVTYTSEPLERRLQRAGSTALVQPNLLTFIPCADLPRLNSGIVDVPSTIVTTRESLTPVRYTATSPFTGVLDLYNLERLPLTDSKDPPRMVAVFAVDRGIRGAALAKPDRTTTAS